MPIKTSDMAIKTPGVGELSWLSEPIGKQPSMVEQAAQLIRELIVNGTLASGERIVESKIARGWKVGQPTVREALKTLEGEGLVTYSPNRGCSVTELSRSQIEQITRLRANLEMLAIEMAVENRANWDPNILRSAIAEMKDAASKGDVNRYYESDLRFHQKLWDLADNPYVSKALSQVVFPLFTFVIRKHYQENAVDLTANALEHEQIAEAVLTSKPKQVRRDVESI